VARKPSSVHPAAEREVSREFRYYQRAAAMGSAFLDAFAAALDRACEAPDAGSPAGVIRGEAIRFVRLRGFPFRLIHVERPSLIRVLAIAHKSRRPGYWRRRV
jgi:toxin ParE1/3/4